ncbi:MAG TPA: heavy-metal-associated domain-containing protein [Longimicrobiales bacterium]
MPTVLLCVDGMKDADDEARVERALRAEPGVYGAVANHEERCAEVDCDDDEVTVDRLIRVVEEAGFGATLAG